MTHQQSEKAIDIHKNNPINNFDKILKAMFEAEIGG